MGCRSSSVAALLAIGVSALAGCGRQDSPVAVQTVRLAVIAGAKHGGAPFAQSLTQEVTTSPMYAGDADGTGSALITVNLGQREVCWDVSVADIVLPGTAAHIHEAPAGVRGGIVVSLTPPGITGRSVGCAADLDAALLQDILTDPESYYVNVHTIDFPAGAIRGQFGR